MDILVTHVYDELRFIHYMQNKFHCSRYYATLSVESINKNGNFVTITGLPSCDVNYLQANIFDCARRPKICNIKIISRKPVESELVKQMKPPIRPSNNNEEPFKRKINNSYKKATCIDISPQPGDEPKQEPLELFHVTFAKIIHYDEMLNERQIQALLKDKNVKSINIEK